MGALDGGLDLPHSDKRFAGFKKDKQLGAEIHLKYIYEGHVADYMKLTGSRFNFCPTLFQSIADEEPKKYQSHFRLQMPVPQGLPNKGSQKRNGLTKKGFALQVQNTFPLPIDDDLPYVPFDKSTEVYKIHLNGFARALRKDIDSSGVDV
ncbi:uncharacterized protein LOC119287664 isoform X2 [Triticum dicoccoides]|uniref:uncharacterized protein LOC119287664 isoform X2 n=1 Tax=Triticum dicoccoides TaxID=85692 RepID=UPI00188E1FB6|nr:uncharacterized protein LOC119287664 isoform X2 [Triticum dicoccoides]